MTCIYSQPGTQINTVYVGLLQHNPFHFAALQEFAVSLMVVCGTLLLLYIPLGWPHLLTLELLLFCSAMAFVGMTIRCIISGLRQWCASGKLVPLGFCVRASLSRQQSVTWIPLFFVDI